MAVEQFQQLTGQNIDPAECYDQLTEDAFKALYAQYLDYAVVGGGPARYSLPRHTCRILNSPLYPPWRTLRGGFLLFIEILQK